MISITRVEYLQIHKKFDHLIAVRRPSPIMTSEQAQYLDACGKIFMESHTDTINPPSYYLSNSYLWVLKELSDVEVQVVIPGEPYQQPQIHTYVGSKRTESSFTDQISEMAFKVLNPEEEAEFRQWARDKFTPGEEIKEIWHPIVRDECAKMAKEAT